VSGWLALAAGVLGYDAWAIRTRRPTMSSACRTWQSTFVRRAAVFASCLALTRHLTRGVK
jgi:hypothetical protein